MGKVCVYAAIGARFTQFDLDIDGAALVERSTYDLPVGVQYAWPHAKQPFLYVACSDGGPGKAGTRHMICALRVSANGALTPHSDPVPLQWRPVHLSTDRDSRHVLVAYNAPSGVSVHRIRDDGTLGAAVPQDNFTLGKTAHQIMVAPSNDRVILPVRGTDAEHGNPEDPGALHVFDFREGVLTQRQVIAPDGGFGFGPRHVDFHPSKPWMYMSIERQNEVALFELGETVGGPKHRKTALAWPDAEKPRQLVGAVHVHPNGRYVYVSNRADGTVDYEGAKVFNGAENTIAVFSIDAQTGEPTLIQTEDTRGMHVRTFHIDPDGRLLVAANMTTRKVCAGEEVRDVPGGLSLFRIGTDGKLQFVRKYDADVSKDHMFWMGMVVPPSA
jgi:6-phosphogluconolactonase (cycloisomerase 2 family)